VVLSPEHSRSGWFNADEVQRLLVHDNIRNLFRAAARFSSAGSAR
jgi:hypothetical protein